MLSNEVASLVLVLKNVGNFVKAVVLNFQLPFYCKDTPVVFQLFLTRLEQLSFYRKNTSAIKSLLENDYKRWYNPAKNFFLFDLGIKTDRIVKAHKMETYTSQAGDLHRHANEVECPVYIPPYTNCYKTLWANYELVQQAREMENAARDIRKQFQEIAASGLSVPSSTSLKKAVVSVKRGKFMFSTDQLAKVVQVLMENFPYILFRPKSDVKEYVILLFWSTDTDDSACQVQKRFEFELSSKK